MSKIIIIGAGPAGLAAAWELTQAGQEVMVIEKDAQVGGISKTINHHGYYFDSGGHRFWTKNEEVSGLWQEVLGSNFLTRPRLSRIYYKNNFFYYPIKIFDALKKLGLLESVLIVGSYLWVKIKKIFKKNQIKTFEDWTVNQFGRRLFDIFFKTYTEKVWGIKTSEIGAEWAAQRIKNLSLVSVIIDSLGLNKKGKIKTLIEEFKYPKLGPGMMYQKMADQAVARGARLLLNTDVARINCQRDKVRSVMVKKGNKETEIFADYYLSSMPLPELVVKLVPEAAEEIMAANKNLWFRSLITVNLIINKKEVIPDTWIYIHDPLVRAGRLQNFKNWSPFMSADENKTNMGLEYFASKGDELYQMSDEELIALGKEDWIKMGIGGEEEIIEAFVAREKNAYPVYQIGYKDSLDKVTDFIKNFTNLQIIGRGGMYRYNNMDHSILTGLYAARNILGGKHDLFKVNTEENYLEYKDDR